MRFVWCAINFQKFYLAAVFLGKFMEMILRDKLDIQITYVNNVFCIIEMFVQILK